MIDKIKKLFATGQPLEWLYPLFEAIDTFLLTPGKRTQKAPFVRDAIDLKRVMICVFLAVMPCFFMGVYNAGYQILLGQGASVSFLACMGVGAMKVLPIVIVTYAVGGFWEVLFAIVRKHAISEGFFVTGILYALIMPPTLPLWQVAVGISFGVVFAKEIFGGVGRNIVNPALMGRAFIFFAYPLQFSGDQIYVALDGLTKATPLAVIAEAPRGTMAVDALSRAGYGFWDAFSGLIPGSIGETSALACFCGCAFLLVVGLINLRIVAGCLAGLFVGGVLFNLSQGPQTLAMATLPFHWHLVLGGFAFGAIFMATDPVTSAATSVGQWIYGILIGALTILIRVINPAYPEGMMLAILLMNVFAPLIDYCVIGLHMQKRVRRWRT
ncbi:NADH:ubiquinone reductase (Na(+)-transporting) subunit B [Candidatus Omnitrophota bacterium]